MKIKTHFKTHFKKYVFAVFSVVYTFTMLYVSIKNNVYIYQHSFALVFTFLINKLIYIKLLGKYND